MNQDILDTDFKQRILFLAGWDLARKLPHVVKEYMRATKENYRYSVRKAILDLQLTRPLETELLRSQFNVEQVNVRYQRPHPCILHNAAQRRSSVPFNEPCPRVREAPGAVWRG